MGQRLAASFAVYLAAFAAPAWAGDDTVSSPVGRQALCFFERHVDSTVDQFLTALRPAPVDAAVRAAVLARLPKEGERRVRRPEPAELAKISAAAPVLQYHARTGVIGFTVIDAKDPFVSLHHRCSIIVSRRALAVLGGEEVAALVAHEIGHEFVWEEYWAASAQADHTRMQELELVCDGIAVLTLRRIGIDPEHLVSAVQKITPTKRQKAIAGTSDYVPLQERIGFIRAVARLPWRQEPAVGQQGHPTGCSSAADLMAALFFAEMRFNPRIRSIR